MEIIKKPYKLTAKIKAIKKNGKSVGFVPTMGALHGGHVSLIKKARKETDIVVLSIFVNPTQFGPKEDYKKYPRNFSRDSANAKKAGVDIIFAPEVKDMYSRPAFALRATADKGFSTFVEEKELSKILEGAIRPGHFKGVTTVVLKLFNIVQPNKSYFGQKDYQQAVIIKKMGKDLNIDTKIKVLPTIREKDGLAMSSRNAYLNKDERKSATILYRSLLEAKRLIANGLTDAEKIKMKMREMIREESSAPDPTFRRDDAGLKIDYIEIREPETLQPIKKTKGNLPASARQAGVVILLAVRIGKVRLIDNMIIRK